MATETKAYDDSYLRRRATCLTSGFILCLVIGIAAMGTSIIALLKLSDLQKRVDILELEQNDLYVKVSHLNKKVDEIIEESPQQRKELKPPPLVAQTEGSVLGTEHEGHVGSIDTEDSNRNIEEIMRRPQIEDPATSRDFDTHSSSGYGELGDDEDGDTWFMSSDRLLCDDSDLCLVVEGSGMEIMSPGDILESSSFQGSGDGEAPYENCNHFSRPNCPWQYKVCNIERRGCLVPVCCLDDSKVDITFLN